MMNEDERFAARIRQAWPAPAPTAGFDSALEARMRGRRRPRWVLVGVGIAAAAAVVMFASWPSHGPVEGRVPTEAVAEVADDAVYAVLDIEAQVESSEILPEDYVALAEVLDF